MGIPIEGVNDWRAFEDYARAYLSELWGTRFEKRIVKINDHVSWEFDLVSEDGSCVGDAKWLKNISVPAAKWQGIAEYIWLLQHLAREGSANRVFLVFGRDAEVAERYLRRIRSLADPVEFFFLDGQGLTKL